MRPFQTREKGSAMLWYGDLRQGLTHFKRKYGSPIIVYCRPNFPILEGKKWTKKHGIRVQADPTGPANLFVICRDKDDWL